MVDAKEVLPLPSTATSPRGRSQDDPGDPESRGKPPAPEQKRLHDRLLSEGILLLAVSVAAYIGCHIYEQNYAQHFGIPAELVVVSVQNMVLLGGKIAAGVLAGAWLFDAWALPLLHLELPKKRRTFIKKYLKRWLFPSSFILITFALSYGPLEGVAICTLVIGLLFGLSEFVAPAVVFKNTPYPVALRRWLRLTRIRQSKSLPFINIRSYRIFSFYFGFVLFGLMTCQMMGEAEASRREVFPFVGGTEIVLRRYGDQLVVAKYDFANRKVLPSFRLVPVNDLKETFQMENIGRVPKVEVKDFASSPIPVPHAAHPK